MGVAPGNNPSCFNYCDSGYIGEVMKIYFIAPSYQMFLRWCMATGRHRNEPHLVYIHSPIQLMGRQFSECDLILYDAIHLLRPDVLKEIEIQLKMRTKEWTMARLR